MTMATYETAKTQQNQSDIIWGVGIEHESAILYSKRLIQAVPRYLESDRDRAYPVAVAAEFDESKSLHRKIDTLITKKNEDKSYAAEIDFDNSTLNSFMEIITRSFKNRTISEYAKDIITTKAAFMEDLNIAVPPVGEIEEWLGPFRWPTTGADYIFSSRELEDGHPQKTSYKDEAGNAGSYIAYLGSYHINITLPHAPDISDREFDARHIAAAERLQWLEPVLLACLGCPSPASVLDDHEVTELSVRHQQEMLATALSRDLNKGFSSDRYGEVAPSTIAANQKSIQKFRKRLSRAKTPTDVNRIVTQNPGSYNPFDPRALNTAFNLVRQHVKARIKRYPLWMRKIFLNYASSPMALKNFVQMRKADFSYGTVWISPVGTDFRRDRVKSTCVPNHPSAKCTRFGFEFRVLDFFDAHYLEDVLRVLFYAMDASSASNKPCPDATRDEAINTQYIACILEGWDTKVNASYQKQLYRVLDIGVPTQLKTMADLMTDVSERLFVRFGNGKGTYSKHVDINHDGHFYPYPPQIPNVNKASWDTFFRRLYPELATYIRSKRNKLDYKNFIRLIEPRDKMSKQKLHRMYREDLNEMKMSE